MDLQRFFTEALDQPGHAIAHHVSQSLACLFPEKVVLEGSEFDFRLEEFAEAGHCQILLGPVGHGQFSTTWDREKGVCTEAKNAWLEVVWEGNLLDVLLMHWDESCYRSYWILAESRSLAERFFSAVCSWKPELEGKILVFEGGWWTKSKRLYREIQGANLDNLVLSGSLKQQIHEDLERFFASRATYERYGLPWKRGVLFTGPPGNGKTHAIKALVQKLSRPCLYAKSFAAERSIDQTNISVVFEAARRMAPCLLVLEDLDTLVDKESRSFFLNELDGFSSNDGLVILATTNHPEKLDPALRDRPSRFDRTFAFELPRKRERLTYLRMWSESLTPEMRLSEEGLRRLAARTKGFSFAYLKELVISSMAAWLPAAEPGGMSAVMKSQARALRRQQTRSGAAKGARGRKRKEFSHGV